MIDFSFASDWVRGWHKFSSPITKHSKAKPMQSRITFDTQLKIAVRQPLNISIYALFTKREVKMARYWPSSFLRFYGPRQS